MAGNKVLQSVESILEGFLKENQLMLYDLELVKEGRDRILRVFIDKEWKDSGEEKFVSTDDCELVSRFLSDGLDEEDFIEENYYLEVSSPGMERQLKKDRDFERYMGRLVDVKLYSGVNGKKLHTGNLKSYEDGSVTVEVDGEELKFTKEQIAKVNLAIVF